MTIEQYKKDNPEFEILKVHKLDFVEPDNTEEAKTNLLYVANNYKEFNANIVLEAVDIAVRSYNEDTIDWDNLCDDV